PAMRASPAWPVTGIPVSTPAWPPCSTGSRTSLRRAASRLAVTWTRRPPGPQRDGPADRPASRAGPPRHGPPLPRPVVTTGQRGSARGTGQQHGGAGQQYGAQEDQVDGPGSRPPVEPVRVAGERDGLQQGEQDGPDGGGQQAARVPLQQRMPGGHPQADQPGA